ncbi:Neuropeptide Y receptor type 2 [Blomia tropicalis]|nr:Neuropeptide Y receptor type 2 [Blomia tropicalis]
MDSYFYWKCFTFATISLLTILCNLIFLYILSAKQCSAYCYNRLGIKSVNGKLLINLIVSDLIQLILINPSLFIYVMYEDWPFGSISCHIISHLQAISQCLIAWSLMLIGNELYRRMITVKYNSNVSYLLVPIWIISLLISIPIGIVQQYGEYQLSNGQTLRLCIERWDWPNTIVVRHFYFALLSFYQFFIPSTIMVYSYLRLFWKNNKRIPSDKAERKLWITMAICSMLYIVIWLPSIITSFGTQLNLFQFSNDIAKHKGRAAIRNNSLFTKPEVDNLIIKLIIHNISYI